MRALNCKHMAQMISLYVAGDLVGAREGEVAAHLAACEGCRRVAEEFSESRSLLAQACAPPEFGAEFYSGIRRAVLSEITRDRRLTKPVFFRRPWLYATSCAAVVVAFLFLLQHFGSARQTPQGIARAPLVSGQPTPGQATVTGLAELPQSPGKSDAPAAGPGTQSHKVRAFVPPRRSPGQFETLRNPDASGTAQAALARRPQVAPAMESSTSGGTAESSTSSGPSAGLAVAAPVSRIEIQTADPNIRIIWLTPSESGESEGTNHDQDQHHGNRK